MRRASVTWTAEMTAELIVRTEAGESAAQIAERLGLKDRHIWKKREHLGIKPPAGVTKLRRFEMDEARRRAGVEKIIWDEAAKARLADMVARRVDLDEIADAFGTTSNAISTKISKMGLRRCDDVDPLVLSRMLELARARWRTSRIAKQLGVDPMLVRVHVGHLVDDRPLGYGRPPVRPRPMEVA